MNPKTYIYGADLKRLFHKKKRLLYRVFTTTFVLVLLFFLEKAPHYTAKASFRQAPAKTEQTADLKNLLQLMAISENPSGATSVLLSDKLLETSIHHLGLQAEYPLKGPLSIAAAHLYSLFSPSSYPPMPEEFSLSHLSFKKESSQKFYIHFISQESYEILDAHKKLFAQGKVGQPLTTPTLSLTITAPSSEVSRNKLYPLRIHPLNETLESVKRKFKIKAHTQDKNLLLLSFKHPSRKTALHFLNTHMQIYQDFLHHENQHMAQAQIHYLEKRQQELEKKLDEALTEQTSYLKENLGEKGFLDLTPELLILSKPKEIYTSKLFEIDVELLRLASTNTFKNPPDTSTMQGLDIPHTKELYLQCSTHIDGLKTEIEQLHYLQEHLLEKTFNLSSLCYVLHDPVTQKLVDAAKDLELKLSDSLTHSLKEHERIEEALHTQKKFLLSHIHQAAVLKQIDQKLCEEKLSTLRYVLIDLLQKEKSVILTKLKELSEQMGDLPQRWGLENKLKMKSELAMRVIEGLSQIAESKNLASNLFYVESKPLDEAKAPLKPNWEPLAFFPLACGLLGGLLAYLYYGIKHFFCGFPLSLTALKESGYPVSGTLSLDIKTSFEDLSLDNLETLRRIAAFFLAQTPPFNSSTGLVLQGKAPSYVAHLARLLSLKGKRVILLDCHFDTVSSYEEIPGLWHFLTEKIAPLPIQHHPYYDTVYAGSNGVIGTELLTSPQFFTLLTELKKRYDLILLSTHAPYTSTEVEALFKIADATAITLENETAEDVSLFFNTPSTSLVEEYSSLPEAKPLNPYLPSVNASTALLEPSIKTELRKSLYRQKKNFPVTFVELKTEK